jgi:palmitoyltransferase ZDHHC9/14/18
VQSTYENFRYRYDRQVNPYNKGIVENFKEVFFSSIPPSKNNFRTKVPIPKESTESSRRRGVDTLMMPVYNEVGEVEKDYKDEEYGKGSELNDTSVDLSSMLHTERGQRQVASFLRQSLWERSSRKWEVTPEVLNEIHEDGESKRITGDSSKEPVDNPTKTDL